MVTVMQYLNRLDRPVGEPTYSNNKVAEMHHNGQLSRSEAEMLDIISASFGQSEEDDTDPVLICEVAEQGEPSCIAIVHEGTVIPIVNLEEIILRPGTPAEKRAICKQASNIIEDVLLMFLMDEGGGKA